MKKFPAIYIGTEAALERAQWKKLDEEKRKALEASGINAWMEWGMTNSAAGAVHPSSVSGTPVVVDYANVRKGDGPVWKVRS